MVLSIFLLQCGGEESNELQVSIIPERPIVIEEDIILPDIIPGNGLDDSTTISGPWFSFRFAVKNVSEGPVTIRVIRAEISGDTDKTQAWDSSIFGQVNGIVLQPEDIYTPPAALYMESIGEDAGNFQRVVQISFKGWTGNSDVPLDRLEKIVTVTTQ